MWGIRDFLLAVLLLLVSGARAATAQELDAPERERDDTALYDYLAEERLNVTVVTASNTEELLLDAPGVVLYVTQREMFDRGYTDLLDLFDDLPGMDVVRPWGDNFIKSYWRGYRTDIGFPFLVMIDGTITNSLWTTEAAHMGAIPLSEIHHVEVVYGPVSSVYGASAFMGVINVITNHDREEDGTYLTGRVSSSTFHFDRFDNRVVDMHFLHKQGKLRFSVAVRHSLGWLDDEAGERFEYTRPSYSMDPALWGGYTEHENLARGADIPFGETGVDIRGYFGGLEVGARELTLDTGYGFVYPTDRAQPYAVWQQRERSVHGRYTADIKGVKSRTLVRQRESGIPNESYFLAGYESGGPEGRVTDFSYWQSLNESFSMFQDLETDVTEWFTLHGGAKYEHKDVQRGYDVSGGPLTPPADVGGPGEANFPVIPLPPPDDLRNENRAQTDDYGVYLQAKLHKTEILGTKDGHNVHLGLRYDHNSVFGADHSPSFRVAYVGRYGEFRGKLLYGEGFLEPTPRVLYGGWQGSGSDINLKPESSRTLELNLSHATKQATNLISVYYTNNFDTFSTFAGGALNEGERNVFGMDYHANAYLTVPYVPRLELYAYYSFIWTSEIKDIVDGVEETGKVGDLADHKVWLGATAGLDKHVTLNARARIVSERKTVDSNPLGTVDGYVVVDAHVMVRDLPEKGVSFGLRANNILDTEYFHPGIRTADSGNTPGSMQGGNWTGSSGWYNSMLPQPGRLLMLTMQLEM